MTIKIRPQDFAPSFGDNMSQYLYNKIGGYGFQYKKLSKKEYDDCIIRIIKVLLSDDVIRAGAERICQWESGWTENLNRLKEGHDLSSIIPLYFNKYPTLRWQRQFIKPVSPMFELNMLLTIVNWLADEYMRDADAIYEFGCGTGHLLTHIRDVNPNAELWGLDWVASSQKIIETYATEVGDDKLFGAKFDYFNPDYNFKLRKDSVVYTVASLEQTGNHHYDFISYLLWNKPKLCIHVEPIAELLDEDNLLDCLSIGYFKKRNYLSGFLTRLHELESTGRIKIIKVQRTYIGSLFIEGYSVVVWTPQV